MEKIEEVKITSQVNTFRSLQKIKGVSNPRVHGTDI